ncbi:MAG: hypothetical protein EBU84_13510 [Actinobacteria bacterium]|nr:hypothetical protein [Actinomycetota bacterium]
MMFRLSPGGAVLWLGGSGVVSLIGLATSETDEACGSFGFVVDSATSCIESNGHLVFKVAGISFLFTLGSMAWSFMRSRF